MSKRPHIIIFNPDEMRADAMAHLGNPAAVTPNIDEFVKEDAISFSNAYCQNPVCVPSRCSFLTGLYPHVHGHRTMSYLLRPGENSLFKELKDSGYYVWMNDRNDLTAGQMEGWTESHANEIYYSGQKKHGPGQENPDIRGGKGDKYFYSHFGGKLKTDKDGKNYNSDDEAVDAAIDRILHPVDERPLCIFLGLVYPHVPYQVEDPYFSIVDRAKLPARICPEECSGKAQILDDIRHNQHLDGLTEEEWNEIRAVYLGMCAKVDAQFGRVIEALKKAGIYDDCAIFFLSDHGDFAGDYGLTEKAQNSFEDCLTRVPLLVKPPKGEKIDVGINTALVELVDFYATAVDYAKIEPSHTHFGRSLRGNIGDKTLPGRKYVFSEGGRQPGEVHCDEYHIREGVTASENTEYWPRLKAQADDTAHAKGIMIRSSRYKYISRTLGEDELSDFEVDAKERHNLIHSPEHQETVNKLQREMLKWLQATDDIVPYEPDQRYTPAMLWAKAKPFITKDNEEAVKKMIEEKVDFPTFMQYLRSLRE